MKEGESHMKIKLYKGFFRKTLLGQMGNSGPENDAFSQLWIYYKDVCERYVTACCW